MCKPGVMFVKNEDMARHMAEFHPYTLETQHETAALPKEVNVLDNDKLGK